jgi:hypothetical protein
MVRVSGKVIRRLWKAAEEEARKHVLFCKKEPKNIYSLACMPGPPAHAPAKEVFLLLFLQKKKVLAS